MIRIDCRAITGDDLGTSDHIRQACDALVKDGFVILDHVLPDAVVEALNEEFASAYAQYTEDREADDTLKVGDRRYMVQIGLSGSFRNPLVYANPFVVALVRQTLEDSAILESFGAILSLSGAGRQPVHRDAPTLFNASIAALLPAHAITFALPLIEMNDLHGTTELWRGSHRWQEANEALPSERPTIPVGSCLLWDFRLYHAGTPNRSNRHRPMIYGTYARAWYQDPANFRKAGLYRLVFDRDFVESQTADVQSLFSHIR